MKLASLGRTVAAPGLLADLRASVVVTLVALPLCLGVAIASGVPPALGLITGIIGGLVVGTLAGSPFQVSGPAAGLTILVWELLHPSGGAPDTPALARLGVCVFLAGVVQFALGVGRLGQWFRAVTPAVVHGMLAGIGMLIFASQLHVMVDDKPLGSGLNNLVGIPSAIAKGLVGDGGGEAHTAAAWVGVLTLAVLAGWKALAPRCLHAVPPPLVAVLAGTLAAGILGLGVARIELPDLGQAVRPLRPADFLTVDAGLLRTALVIAVIASAETLLCAAAVDGIHTGPRTRYDQELAAQGVGNMICGLLGALPMTGVIVRSAANVEAGAKTRRAAVLHGA